ncbi:unnamed protein product [Ixodes hexagonus]
MSGHVGDLSPRQEVALQQLKVAVGELLNEKHDDRYLLRWLRARDFNVNKAEQMLREHMKWRNLYGADDILSGPESPEVLRKYYPGGMVGHDREGHPVWLIPFGGCDLKGMLMSVTKTDMIKHVIWSFELIEQDLRAQSKKLGKPIETQTYIFDFDNYSLRSIASKAVLDFLTDLMCTFEAHYPERLKKAVVINAPRIFPMFWRLIRPFLSEATANKLHLFGREGWKEALLADIQADQLPVFWGGTMTDPDGNPRCPSIVVDGGEVPRRYYRSYSKPSGGRVPTPHEDAVPGTLSAFAVVDRQSSLDVPVEVNKEGSQLTWEFYGEDVIFGIFYRDEDAGEEVKDKVTEVVKSSRIKGLGKVAETGFVTCTRAGTYLLRFDNSFSWLTSKKVNYTVKLTAPS